MIKKTLRLFSMALCLVIVLSSMSPVLAQNEETTEISATSAVQISYGNDLISNGKYNVDIISTVNKFHTQASYDSYVEAYKYMLQVGAVDGSAVIRHKDSKGSLKVVAAYQGFAYSFPTHIPAAKRNTNYKQVQETVTLFKNENLTTSTGVYLSDDYPMEYYGTSNTSGALSSFTVLVSVQGAKGYLDIDSVDIIPLKYVENAWAVSGYYLTSKALGNNTFQDQTNNFTYYPEQTAYIVKNQGTYKELTIEFRQAGTSRSSNAIGIVPNDVPDGKYYSPDGVNFYKDRFFKNPLIINGAIYQNYVYYRDIYLRTKTTLTGAELDAYMKNKLGEASYNSSKLKDAGALFIAAQDVYGVNALLIYAIAINESGNGLSSIARNKNNLFGINAVDSNPDDAYKFESVKQNIEYMMGAFLTSDYLDIQWTYYGAQIGTKDSGIGTRYASDPFWNVKAVNHAYIIDKTYNFKDYNKVALAKLQNNQVIVYKNPNVATNVSTNILHNYTRSLTNDISVAIIGEVGDFYMINTTTPVGSNGELLYPRSGEYTKYNWTASVGYIKKTDVKLISVTEIPTIPEVVEVGEEKTYIVFDGPLNVRSEPSTSGTILGQVNQSYLFKGKLMSNGWIKLTLDGKTGYVSGDFVRENTDSRDLNGDGKITIADIVVIRRHIMGIEIYTGDKFNLVDLNKDGKISIADVIIIRRKIMGLDN